MSPGTSFTTCQPRPFAINIGASRFALKHSCDARRNGGMNGSAQGPELAVEAPLRTWQRGRGPRSEAVLVREAKRGSADAVEELVRSNWDRGAVEELVR